MKVTAENITDDQIRGLRESSAVWLDANGCREGTNYDEYFQHTHALNQADIALGRRRARKGGSRSKSRARCAQILNSRTPDVQG